MECLIFIERISEDVGMKGNSDGWIRGELGMDPDIGFLGWNNIVASYCYKRQD